MANRAGMPSPGESGGFPCTIPLSQFPHLSLSCRGLILGCWRLPQNPFPWLPSCCPGASGRPRASARGYFWEDSWLRTEIAREVSLEHSEGEEAGGDLEGSESWAGWRGCARV